MRRLAVAVIGILFIATVAYVGWDVMVRAMRMQPARATAAELSAAKPGQNLKFVARIDARRGDSTLDARLLEPVTDTEYRATAKIVHVRLEPDMRVIMGTTADLRAGAIVQLDGTLGNGGTLAVRRAVNLSAYIHVAAR